MVVASQAELAKLSSTIIVGRGAPPSSSRWSSTAGQGYRASDLHGRFKIAHASLAHR
jgi:hypothetical protein